MSLPAAERGRSFGSLAAVVLGNIDYNQIQHKLFSPNGIGDGDGDGKISKQIYYRRLLAFRSKINNNNVHVYLHWLHVHL